MRALIAASLIAGAALSGCMQDPDGEEPIRHRALLLRSCASGVLVGLDPKTGKLTWETTWTGGLVSPGVTADQVCARQQRNR